jgi:uncharacterized membrane protein
MNPAILKAIPVKRAVKDRFNIFLVLTILYALLIFYLSSQSSLGSPGAILDMEIFRSILHYIERSDLKFMLYPLVIFSAYPDKIAHIMLYAVFGFLLYLTMKHSPRPAFRNHALMFVIAIGILYGISDEFHQSFVPGRTASIWDLLADSIGIAIAQAVIFARNKISKKKTRASTPDLKLAAVLIILSIIFILLPPFNQTYLRIILALPLLLFLPGYLLISVMFPKRGEISPIERFTLSIGLSIAITVFDGFALNYTEWGFRPNSIVISLSVIMALLLTAAYFQRWRLGEAAYSFSFKDITAFYRTVRTKETVAGPEYDPALEKMLIRTMVIAIIIVSAMLIYAKLTTEPEKFTALYILGANGKAENYPAEISIGMQASILAGIENYEHAPVNYTLEVKLGGRTLKEEAVVLDHGNKWLDNVTFIPQLTPSIAFAGANKSMLEFQLLKDNKPYRTVHLWVNTSLDSVKFAELPIISNENMESDEGWIFSGSSPDITGNYTNDTINSSSRAYEMNFTAEDEGSYGAVYQNLTTNGDARALLSFDVRDSEYSNISYYVFKQALLDGQVVWESGIGGKNTSWEHVEVPVLLSGNNTLAFRVYSKYKINCSVTVWWDDVQLKPYSTDKTQAVRKPVRKVYEYSFDVRGAPLALEKSMRISGFSFPGFNYNFSGNSSYEELSLELSDGNQIDTGNATYTARVNGSELYLMGSRYRILGKDMPTNLSRILETYPNKTIKLGETWNFGDVYSLSVSLISSKGDSAMLVMRKSGSTLDTILIGRGEMYEYRTNAGKFSVTVFKAKIDSISGDNVSLMNIELCSDVITELNLNSTFGDFEVDNISSDEIVFKNSYPIELNDKTVILDGSMGLSLQGNMLYPYASGVGLRGTPQYIYAGRWMNITGFNYPGFYLENGTSYEELRMHFSGNGLVGTGEAVYTARVHSGILSFLGSDYEVTEKPGIINAVTSNKKIILYDNETQDIGKYRISFKKLDNDSIAIYIKKFSKEEQKLLNETIESNITFFPDVYYEIYSGKKTLRKSNILGTGDAYEYWEEYREDITYKALAGELISINNSSIELTIREYSLPLVINPGKSYGEFEVDSISNDAIVLKNIKPLQFILGEEKTILNGALKIKTSPNQYLAHPAQ